LISDLEIQVLHKGLGMKINSLIDALVLSCFIIMLCCAPAAAQALGPEAQNQLSAMQDVIDKQQSEINQQNPRAGY
jgi:hypothetical protein